MILNIIKRSYDNRYIAHSRYKPNWYIEKFRYNKIIKTDQLNYSLIGTQMLYYPNVDVFEIKYPIITTTSKKHTSLTLSSNCAIIEKNHAKIHMFGNVHGHHHAIIKNKPIYFKTEYLLFLDNKIAKTDQPIEITIDTLMLSGKGMIINNTTQELRLLHNVHGIYR